MKYFFVLGNHPKLSLAGLVSVLGTSDYQLSGSVAIFELPDKDPAVLMSILGGTIKIGQIKLATAKQNLAEDITKLILEKAGIGRKFFFGLSMYGGKFDQKAMALSIKKGLQNQGIGSRWVQSREPVLSSVIVKTNKLLSSRGCEVVIIDNGTNLLLGVTQAVQEFAEFSERDYGRPARDSRSGMIPPKLARIMINLARVGHEASILDPFCGSGTILQEAAVMGYQNLTGSDISPSAIKATTENLKWLESGRSFKFPKLDTADARKLSQTFPLKFFDAIITEPYLGPPLQGHETSERIKQIIDELSALYQESFLELAKIIKPSVRAVIVLPVIGGQRLPILERLAELGWQIDNQFIDLYDDKKRQSFIYGREGQLVEREIVVLNFKLKRNTG